MATKVWEKDLGSKTWLFVRKSDDGSWESKGKRLGYLGTRTEKGETYGIPWKTRMVWLGAHCLYLVRFRI